MPRIAPVSDTGASQEEAQALGAITAAWGAVPQLGRVIARSHPLTRALLAFDRELRRGRFTGVHAEMLAIAVANENRCPYCLAAHTAAARALGLDDRGAGDARTGVADDAKIEAALAFAQAVVRTRGRVADQEIDAVRNAGWADGDIVELVGHVIASTLTNYLHHLSGVPVDFPAVDFAGTDVVERAA